MTKKNKNILMIAGAALAYWLYREKKKEAALNAGVNNMIATNPNLF